LPDTIAARQFQTAHCKPSADFEVWSSKGALPEWPVPSISDGPYMKARMWYSSSSILSAHIRLSHWLQEVPVFLRADEELLVPHACLHARAVAWKDTGHSGKAPWLLQTSEILP